MSEFRFTDGNLIILYAIHKGKSSDGELPDYIKERVKVGLEVYGIIMHSKPDKHKTMVIIVGNAETAEKVKALLVQGGVDQKIIAVDSSSENMAQTFDNIFSMIRTKFNPPYIYFVGSVWLRNIYDSTVLSKMKGFRVQFAGALDHRPVNEVEQERALDVPKKGKEYYKNRAKNKAVDMLLNYIFPD